MSVKKVCGIIGLVMAAGAIAYAISKRETIKMLMKKHGWLLKNNEEIEEC